LSVFYFYVLTGPYAAFFVKLSIILPRDEWLQASFALTIEFIAHFYTAHSHTLQFTTTHTYVHRHVYSAVAW
jgi:hypothetical protein